MDTGNTDGRKSGQDAMAAKDANAAIDTTARYRDSAHT